MAGQSPLIVVNALVKRAKTAAGTDKVEISRLNLGPQVNIDVSTDTVTITGSFHTLTNIVGGTQNVNNILGGEEGDLLIIGGDSVRIRSNGNIAVGSPNILTNEDTMMFIFDGVEWLELSRS